MIIPPSASSEPLGGAETARRAEACHAHPSHRETGIRRQEVGHAEGGLFPRLVGYIIRVGRPLPLTRWHVGYPADSQKKKKKKLAKTPAVRYDTPAPANENSRLYLNPRHRHSGIPPCMRGTPPCMFAPALQHTSQAVCRFNLTSSVATGSPTDPAANTCSRATEITQSSFPQSPPCTGVPIQ